MTRFTFFKQKRKIFAIVLICTFVFAVAGITGCSTGKAEAEAQFKDEVLETAYNLNQTLTVPDATLSYNGNNYPSESHEVTYPDGRIISGNEVKLSIAGEYSVKYHAESKNTRLYAIKKFTVREGLVTFSGNKSVSEYEKSRLTDTYGLKVSLAKGETAAFNKTINLKDYNINKSFIEFNFLPSAVGLPDAHVVYLTLTDVYDASNWIIIRMSNWSDMGARYDGWTLMDAKTPGQEWTSSVHTVFSKRGEHGKGWYACESSMVGRLADGTPDYGTVAFYMDYDERAIVTDNNVYGSKYMVDFDNPYWYDQGTETLWKGFTTGEVRVSLSAKQYSKGFMNLLITKFGDADLSEASPQPSAPVILPDLDGYTAGNLPQAVVNGTCKIFDSAAYDVAGNALNTTVSVYYDYDGERLSCAIADKTFTPERAGIYTIVYSAEDKFGNLTEKTLDITVLDTYLDFDFNIINPTNTATAGVAVKIFDGLTASNNLGKVRYDIKAKLDGSDVSYTVDNESFTFTPLHDGTYTVEIAASDYSRRVVKDVMTFTAASEIFFEKQPQLPDYLIANATYTFPQTDAWIIVDGAKEAASVSVYADGVITENKYTVPEAAVTVTLSYKAVYKASETEMVFYNIPVIDTGYKLSGDHVLNLTKYFVLTSGALQMDAQQNFLMLTVPKKAADGENACFDFINMVQVYNFSTSFSVHSGEGYAPPVEFNIYLRDCVNPDLYVKFTFYRNERYTDFYINDNTANKISIAVPFTGDSALAFPFTYNNATKKATTYNGATLSVNSFYDESPFNGFENNLAKLSYEVDPSTIDSSGIKLYDINGQSFTNADYDNVKPQMFFTERTLSVRLGGTAKLTAPIVFDVLDPYNSLTLKVTAGGVYVRADCGTLLDGSCDPFRDYYLTFSAVREYTVLYEVVDSAGNKANDKTYLGVSDKPNIQIQLSSAPNSAKKGRTVALAKPVLTGDGADLYKVEVYVKNPEGKLTSAKDELLCDTAGVYTVYYYASDGFSIITASYEITVR